MRRTLHEVPAGRGLARLGLAFAWPRRLAAALLAACALLLGAAPISAPAQTLYLHNDPLGSPLLATDLNGTVAWSQKYRPYGDPMNRGVLTDGDNALWFGGKPFDAVNELSYFGARYYDPVIGRFMAPDPKAPDPEDLHSLNRYAYANANPYRHRDPDGRAVETWVDVISLGLSIHEFRQNPSFWNALGVAYDAVAAATPFLPGGVGILRAAGKADELTGVAKGAEKGGLNLFKWGKDTTTKADGWKEGDFMLHLPDKGSPKANWAQNSSRLREEMGRGNPIYDSYRNPTTGERIPTRGFLRAERNLLESRGWKYDSSTGAYHPPGN